MLSSLDDIMIRILHAILLDTSLMFSIVHIVRPVICRHRFVVEVSKPLILEKLEYLCLIVSLEYCNIPGQHKQLTPDTATNNRILVLSRTPRFWS